MKTLLTSIVFAVSLTLPAVAEPFCKALETVEELPKKYQKRGPFYSDAASGWIIGADQLKGNFEITHEVVQLWKLIAAEFEARGAQLVVLAAPPRPLFVPGDALHAMGLGETFNRDDMAGAFGRYISALNEAGIVAPDLSELSLGDAASDFYFKRDTHWTPQGAALSAAHLKAAMGGTTPAETLADIAVTGTYVEKGSLSTVAEQACATRPSSETVPSPDFTKQGTAALLLSDADDGPRIALIGTSFSDRYQRDAYQVADALAHALDGSVENHAMTGGGLVGSMSAFIQSGALRNGAFQTVVWEAPYTAPLTQVSGLRQLLGELYALEKTQRRALQKVTVSDDWISVSQAFDTNEHVGVEINTPDHSTGTLAVELIAQSGKKTRIKLIKSNRISSAHQSENWRFSFAELGVVKIDRIKVRFLGVSTPIEAQIQLF